MFVIHTVTLFFIILIFWFERFDLLETRYPPENTLAQQYHNWIGKSSIFTPWSILRRDAWGFNFLGSIIFTWKSQRIVDTAVIWLSPSLFDSTASTLIWEASLECISHIVRQFEQHYRLPYQKPQQNKLNICIQLQNFMLLFLLWFCQTRQLFLPLFVSVFNRNHWPLAILM